MSCQLDSTGRKIVLEDHVGDGARGAAAVLAGRATGPPMLSDMMRLMAHVSGAVVQDKEGVGMAPVTTLVPACPCLSGCVH